MSNAKAFADPWNKDKPWFIWARRDLSFADRIRLLFGARLYVRFDSPNGECHAACDLSHQITRSDYDHVQWSNIAKP